MNKTELITEDDLFDIFMLGMVVGFIIGFAVVCWAAGL